MSDILEVYEREVTVYLNRDTESIVAVSMGQFTRTVLRRKEGGPDLLVDQFVENGSTYEHVITLGFADFESKERFREKIVANPPPSRVIPEGSNWDWSKVADYILDFVPVENVRAADGYMTVAATVAIGKLSIIEEDNGWLLSESGLLTLKKIPPLITGGCNICHKATIGSHEPSDLLRLFCGHVYHKNCIFPVIWREQVWETNVKIGCPTHCPLCGEGDH